MEDIVFNFSAFLNVFFSLFHKSGSVKKRVGVLKWLKWPSFSRTKLGHLSLECALGKQKSSFLNGRAIKSGGGGGKQQQFFAI